jgi:SWI/SNF-related matrix-associated actin-dependent regulator 1 of chromatin subfamily A
MENSTSLSLFQKAYKLTGISKVQGVIDFCNNLVEEKLKFLVFAHHITVLDQLESNFVKKKVKFIRIDGTTKPKDRFDYVEDFQKDDEILVAILSITAASQGLTLTKASRVIFAEMHWTPFLMQQAEDRCHRNSQKNNVTCYYMFGESTLDKYIYDVISQKFNVVSNIIDGNFGRNMNFMDQEYKGKVEKEYTPFFWLEKGIGIEEMVDEAIHDKIYGDITERELIKEIIETEMHEERNKKKKMEEEKKKQIEEDEKKKSKKTKETKFGLFKFFNSYNKKEREIKTKKLKIVEDYLNRKNENKDTSN